MNVLNMNYYSNYKTYKGLSFYVKKKPPPLFPSVSATGQSVLSDDITAITYFVNITSSV